MKTFKLIISSPEGDLYNGLAECLSIRGVEGELAVMANHIPFVTAVKPCECKITLENDDVRSARIDGGILNVASDSVRLLAGSFEWI